MLQCDHLVKKYRSQLAVNDLSLRLEEGKIYALLGPNGSGKSTFMKIAAGLIKPTSGRIFFHDKKIGKYSKAHITYMPTEVYFYPYMTWKDAGKYYQDFYADFNPDTYYQLLSDFDLDPKGKITKMSSGMASKGKLALALARESDLCMLDEPLNGIDIIARDQVLDAICDAADSDTSRTFIISSHLVNELETIADEALFIRKGSLVLTGDIDDLIDNYQMPLTEIYKNIYRSTNHAI